MTPKTKSIEWVRFWPLDEPAVWCDIKKLDAGWKLDDGYVSFGGEGSNQRGKYEKVGIWLEKSNKLWMPCLSLHEGGVISFTDGRHRFSWLRDHGAASICITTDPSCAKELREHFGTKIKKTEFLPPTKSLPARRT